MYLIKFIESYYLGLNFLGQVQPLDIIARKEIETGAGRARVRVLLDTNYNLFNFDHHFDAVTNQAVPVDNMQFFYTFNNKLFNRPTNVMSVINTLLHTEHNLNYLINALTQRLLFVFNNMGNEKSTLLYANAISYLYPDLLILSNYSKIFLAINGKLEIYNKILNDVETITRVSVVDSVNNFKTFKLKQFESLVNQINGYIYLMHYFNATTDKMKLPSLIYHTLNSEKPLIIFDGEPLIVAGVNN
jgi:hypothetical protein